MAARKSINDYFTQIDDLVNSSDRMNFKSGVDELRRTCRNAEAFAKRWPSEVNGKVMRELNRVKTHDCSFLSDRIKELNRNGIDPAKFPGPRIDFEARFKTNVFGSGWGWGHPL